MNLNDLLTNLWVDYSTLNPSAKKIHRLFEAEGEKIENDHIAFRTFSDPRINIEKLATSFLKNGYKFKKEYFIEDKNLRAKHFEHESNPNSPKIFISEFRLENTSLYIQNLVKELVDSISPERLEYTDLLYSGNIWGKPKYDIYKKLRDESEYAAWLYVFGFRANHFTININSLRKYNSIEKVNQFLKDNGYVLNQSGGEIKGSKKDLLQQSSTLADIIYVTFEEGNYEIPACYYEFALRYPDDSGKLFNGFIAQSANKIFESTNYYEKR